MTTMFPSDAIARAKLYLSHVKGTTAITITSSALCLLYSKLCIYHMYNGVGGLGAYSDSRGNPYIRQEIANFIAKKHSVPQEAIENVFVQNGASECVRLVLRALIRGPNDGIMVPIPQYPLYSASIQLFNGSLVGYYLDGRWHAPNTPNTMCILVLVSCFISDVFIYIYMCV